MRRKRHFRTGEAWDWCYICGHTFPMSELVASTSEKSLGRLVCRDTCIDNTDIERHKYDYARVLANGTQYEGTDIRPLRWRFFGNPEGL